MTKPSPTAGENLPDTDHVLRYIAPRHIDNGVVNGSGFLRRPQETAASVNWLEWFDPPVENQVIGVRNASRLKYASNGVLARLDIGETRRYVKAHAPDGTVLRFVHDPLPGCDKFPADLSHALISGVPEADTPEAALLKDLIADCVIAPLYPAKLKAS